jgi:phasin family protein
MPASPETPRPRRKPKLSEEALASRLAASLDPKTAAAPSEPMPKRIAAEPPAEKKTMPEPVKPAEPPAALSAVIGALPTSPAPTPEIPAHLFSTGVARLTGAVSTAQELARDTAQSLADTRLKAAHSIVAFQKKLLEMVHANLNEGFAAAHKLVNAPNVGEAIRVQSSFAQTRVKALSDQAAELGSLSARLAQEAREPWAAHMTRSLDRMKTGLSA